MRRGQHAKPSNNRTKKIATAAGITIGGVSMPLVMAPNANAATMESWERVAKCESNSRWDLPYGDNNKSSGGVQFQPASWNGALGYLRSKGIDTSKMPQGSGHQAYKATKEQQILAGEALLAMQGPRAWAVTVDAWGARCGAHGALSEGSMFEGGPSPFGPGADLQAIANGGKGAPSASKPKPPADRPEASKPHDHYTVVKGDTLSSIADKLGVKGGWKELYRWSTRVVSDPHRIEIGMELNVPKSANPPKAKPAPEPAPKPEPPKPEAPEPKPEAPEPKPEAPKSAVHAVIKGDTLWDIAGTWLNDNLKWPEIYKANTNRIDDPHWIFPGQRFVIPGAPAADNPAPAKPDSPAPKPPADPVESEVLALVNAERAKVGIDELVADKALDDYATNWSKQMASDDRMYHSDLNFPGSPRGENVAQGYKSAESVMRAWMDSPGHKKNILSDKYTKMGIGRVDNWWTQVFAGDGAAKPTPKPAPKVAGWVSPIDARPTGAYDVRGGCFSRSQGCHSGVDFAAPSGTPVKAVSDATVVHAGYGGAGGPYGNHVILKLADGKYALYGHLSKSGVSEGQTVTAGQTVGLVGSTGTSTGPHLHFEVRHHATAFTASNFLNPVAFLRSKGVTI